MANRSIFSTAVNWETNTSLEEICGSITVFGWLKFITKMKVFFFCCIVFNENQPATFYALDRYFIYSIWAWFEEPYFYESQNSVVAIIVTCVGHLYWIRPMSPAWIFLPIRPNTRLGRRMVGGMRAHSVNFELNTVHLLILFHRHQFWKFPLHEKIK